MYYIVSIKSSVSVSINKIKKMYIINLTHLKKKKKKLFQSQRIQLLQRGHLPSASGFDQLANLVTVTE